MYKNKFPFLLERHQNEFVSKSLL